MSIEKFLKCSFCGFEFSEEEAKSSCGGCLVRSCEKICCPNCGYEYIPEPEFVGAIRNWRKRGKKEMKK
jgi:rubredoxin